MKLHCLKAIANFSLYQKSFVSKEGFLKTIVNLIVDKANIGDCRLPAAYAMKNIAYDCDENVQNELCSCVESLMNVFGDLENPNGMNE